MNNKIIDISVKRAQLKKNIKDNSILYDDMDEVDQDEYELLQGIDIATYPDGTKYVGEFNNGDRHGQGTSTFSWGEKYVGGYKINQKHGYGTYTFSDGAKYVGQYRNNKKHGKGVGA